MVNGALSIGGFLGVLLSGAFVYFEIGRFAAPQVPRSLFDERRAVFAYTAGLFVGIPLAFVYLLLESSISNGAAISAGIDLLLFVTFLEVAQWALGRTSYFGRAEATPIYALGFRAGIGGILILGAVTYYLGGLDITWDGLAARAAEALALLAIQVNGGLLSLPRPKGTATGGPTSGWGVGLAAMLVLSFGLAAGTGALLAASLLVIAGTVPSYRRLRRRLADSIQPTPERPPVEGEKPFGRTER